MANLTDFDPFAEIPTTLSSSSILNDVSEEESEYGNEEEEDSVVPYAINFNTYQQPGEVKTNFCCQIDREIHSDNFLIQINHAQKVSDNNGSTFITYTINVGVSTE